ncbi:hypothetical protein MTO96_007109 [Rhipicephalus appendiculatus]
MYATAPVSFCWALASTGPRYPGGAPVVRPGRLCSSFSLTLLSICTDLSEVSNGRTGRADRRSQVHGCRKGHPGRQCIYSIRNSSSLVELATGPGRHDGLVHLVLLAVRTGRLKLVSSVSAGHSPHTLPGYPAAGAPGWPGC